MLRGVEADPLPWSGPNAQAGGDRRSLMVGVGLEGVGCMV